MQPTVLFLVIVYLISLTGTRFAHAQCYSFSSGSNASLEINIPNLPNPSVTREQDRITYNYPVTSAITSLTIEGTTVTGVSSYLSISIVSGTSDTILTMQISGSFPATPNPPGGSLSVGLYLEAGPTPAFPLGLLPNGLPSTLPDISNWTVTQNNKISGAILFPATIVRIPGVYGSPITSVGSCNPPQCTIEATTLAHVPGTVDTERVIHGGRIGVGEKVRLSLTNGDVTTWAISSGHGLLTQATSTGCSDTAPPGDIVGTQACFTAPDTNDSATITANEGPGVSCTIPFATVQPTGLIFQRMQYPKNNPDFYLFFTLSDFNIHMESMVFVTPGDVSFANVFFTEEDVVPEQQTTKQGLNVLFNVANTQAWLVGCDYDHDTTIKKKDPLDPKQAYWVYKMSENGKGIPFSLVETKWSSNAVGFFSDVRFQKSQISALTGSGSFSLTPNAPPAVLEIPAIPPVFYWNDLIIVRRNGCIDATKNQFNAVP